MTTCKACGEVVRWVTTEADRRMPINPTPDPTGTVVMVNGLARVLTAAERDRHTGARYLAHHATCPHADSLRNRRGGRRGGR